MSREEIEKLLGGYATDSLTPEERQELFAAALDDQSLFDELAREEALRDVLREPSARAQVLAALDAAREPWHRRLTQWLGRPAGLAALAGTAAAAITLGVFFNFRASRFEPALVTEVRKAEVRRPDVAPRADAIVPTTPAPTALQRAEPLGETPRPPAQVAAEKVAAEKVATGKAPAGKPAESAIAQLAPPPPPPAEMKDAVGVVGGVPGGVAGGVIGGILPGQARNAPPPPPPPPARKQEMEDEKKELASADSGRQNSALGRSLSPPPVAAPPPTRASTPAPAVAKTAAEGEVPGALSARALFDASTPAPRFRDESSELRGPSSGGGAVGRLSAGKAKKAAAPAAMMASAVAVPHLGLRYSVLRATPGGAFAEVDFATVFARGEQVRLAFETNDSGYLYVLQREAGGGWRQLAGERIERRTRRVVPAEGALAYEEPGAKQLYIFFSRAPEPALATLDPLLLDQRIRGSQLVQKVEDKSVYVVNTNAAPQLQQVGHTITLNYR